MQQETNSVYPGQVWQSACPTYSPTYLSVARSLSSWAPTVRLGRPFSSTQLVPITCCKILSWRIQRSEPWSLSGSELFIMDFSEYTLASWWSMVILLHDLFRAFPPSSITLTSSSSMHSTTWWWKFHRDTWRKSLQTPQRRHPFPSSYEEQGWRI